HSPLFPRVPYTTLFRSLPQGWEDLHKSFVGVAFLAAQLMVDMGENQTRDLALPQQIEAEVGQGDAVRSAGDGDDAGRLLQAVALDRKSTRLNSSHQIIS